MDRETDEKPGMTQQQAQAFKARWQAVNDATWEEVLQATPEERLRQLASLMQDSLSLGWQAALERETEPVRERWCRLRAAFGHG